MSRSMMVKSRFERFSFFFLAGLFLVSCGSAQRSTASPELSAAAKRLAMDTKAELSAAQTVDGSIVILSVKLPDYVKDSVVSGEFEGITLPFFKNGELYETVLGVPYDHPAGNATVKVRVSHGGEVSVVEASFTVMQGDYASETLSVDGRHVEPKSPRDLRRIKRESIEINEAYETITPTKYWKGPFSLPIPNTSFTSRFGTRRVYNGVKKSAHLGLDFKAKVGTKIFASSAGKVVLAMSLFYTGNTVMIDHGYGVKTLYCHLSKLRVKKGQEIKEGALLGLSGKTGRVTGPHLHWMAVIHKQKVNPLDLTKVMK